MTCKSITLHDFDKICRTCLGDEIIGSVLDLSVNNITAMDLLHYFLLSKSTKNECLPSNICETCLKELYRCYEFTKQCRENEYILKLLVEKPTNPQLKEQPSKTDDEIITIIEENYKPLSEDPQDQVNKLIAPLPLKPKRRRPQTSDSNDPKRPYQCKECKRRFFLQCKLKDHMRTHTKEKPFECNICFRTFSMMGNMVRHQMIHTGKRPHRCTICGKGFIQSSSLHTHEKTHALIGNHENTLTNSPMNFRCNVCGRGFKRLAPYHSHIKKHETPPTVVITPTPLKKEALEQHDYICHFCPKSCKSPHLLKAHLLRHGEKSFLCSDCGKSFVSKGALQSHLRVHTGEKPHTCMVCQKSFAHVGTFESHMLIHTGHKPYSCSYCPKRFVQLTHLTYHLRTHTGEKPYSCSFCGRGFALKGNLTVHVRTHTGETPYLCTVCGKGFYDSSSMKKHTRQHGENDGIVKSEAIFRIPVVNSSESALHVFKEEAIG